MWLQRDIEIWKKIIVKMQNAKNSARSLRSLVIYEILKSQIYFFDKGHIMSITDKSTLLYRHNNVIDQQNIEIYTEETYTF